MPITAFDSNSTLFIQGGVTPASGAMNLWTGGANRAADAQVDLTVWNSQVGTDASTFLLIAGSGVSDGATPFDNSMNLFLSRNPADGCTLFLQGAGQPVNGGVDLTAFANDAISSGVPLVMPQVTGPIGVPVPLHICGW